MKKTKKDRKLNKILKKVEKNKIDINRAYEMIYNNNSRKREKRSHFIKLRIKTKESRGVDRFLGFVFLLPIPIFLITLFIKDKHLKNSNLSKKDLKDILRSKDILLNLKTDDGVTVKIKTI
ncbi:hypothetical protein LJC17_01245 [Acholeplasma sp. OttesenSCG-928-E16]|nr:hypothetical protein [Acholeplasma sp. OttesenSCG-928-E16]